MKIKIKFLFIIFLFLFTLSCFAKGISGSGTEKDPFLIYTLEGLERIGSEGYPLDAHYKLAADINAGITREDDYGSDSDHYIGWKPINGFSGIFDGQGYKIIGLNVSGLNAGLFGKIKGAKIYNLRLERAYINGRGYTGGIVAYNDGGKLMNVFFEGYVSGDGDTGGLVGLNKGEIKRSNFKGNVVGETIGGLVGDNNGSISQSYVLAKIEGSESAGGLTSYNGHTIEQSYFIGNIKGRSSVDTGRLVGWNTYDASIKESYAIVTIEITDPIEDNPDQKERYHHDGGLMAGGLIGTNGWQRLVDETGKCTGEKLIGKVERSYYWDIDEKNIDNLGSDIKNRDTYKGWNFKTVWKIENSYPKFQWEDNKDSSDVEHDNFDDKTDVEDKKEGYKKFKGLIDKYHITMKIKENNTQVSGYYYYDKFKKEIKIRGSIDMNNKIKLKEFIDGDRTGQFIGKYYGDTVIGKWSSPDNKEYTFILYLSS